MNDAAQPVIGRARSLLDQVLRIAQTRLELLAVEIQQEKIALSRQLLLASLTAICALLAGLTLIVWVALAFPPETRLIVLGVLFGVLVIGGVGCWLALKRQARRDPLFSRVIHQLRLDRSSLSDEQQQ
jgi:uncharacterized membrane protein YqjE